MVQYRTLNFCLACASVSLSKFAKQQPIGENNTTDLTAGYHTVCLLLLHCSFVYGICPMINDIAMLQVSRASQPCLRKVEQQLYTRSILLTYLAIQEHQVHFITIQFATMPRKSLVIAFILPLPLLKSSVHHLLFLAYRSTDTWWFTHETLALGHFVRLMIYWIANTVFPRIVYAITINLEHWICVNTKRGKVQLCSAMQFERPFPHIWITCRYVQKTMSLLASSSS